MFAPSKLHTGRGRALRRALPAVLAVGAALALPALAGAHAVVQPSASRPADLQRYTVTIPNEGSSPTTEVALKIPQGIDFLLTEKQGGWTVSNKAQDASRTVRWSGGSIPPNFFASFQFIARNPVKAGPIEWKIVQTYADGKAQRWIGPAGSEEPAARTEITESAPQVDVVNVEEGGSGQSGAGQNAGTATAGQAKADDDDDGTDWVPIALGAVALVVAVAALVMARRRTS